MRTKILVALVAVAMLVVGITAVGSNMGFKISIPLTAASGTHDGINWVSLPFYCSYADADAMFNDIPGCVEVDRYDPTTSSYLLYDGFIFMDNFAVAPGGELDQGAAFLIKVGADTPWVVVGSHAPSKQVPLTAASGTHDGINWVSIPYHTTKTDADGLFNEISGCVEVDRYDPTTGAYLLYDGFIFLDNFPVTAGVGIIAKVGADTNWTPAHY